MSDDTIDSLVRASRLAQCPECGEWVLGPFMEVEHMNTRHPDVITQRLRDAGFVFVGGRWVDTLAADD